jgi:hypothetical protein
VIWVSRFQRYGLYWLSIALFVLCLSCDGYYIEGQNPRAWAPSWGLLLIGWSGLFYGTFSWLANPALFAAWFMFYRRRYWRATICGLIAAVLMLSFLLTKTIVSSEAPTYSRVIGHGIGYWLWVASAFVLLSASIAASISGAGKSG